MKKIYFLWFLMLACFQATAQQDCESAIALPVDGGTQLVNYVEGTTGYWYSYTAEEDVVVTLMYCGTASVSMSAQSSCDGSPAVYGTLYCNRIAYTGRGMKIQVKHGETYYICIMAYTSFDSFDVTVASLRLGGETCENALIVSDGETCLPVNLSGYSGATWVSYTATQTGRLTIGSPTASYLPSVFRYEDCEDATGTSLPSVGNVIKTGVVAGERLLLKFANTEPLDVTFDCTVLTPGTDCEVPLEATEGKTNVCNATRTGDHWYRFVPDRNGYIEVSACNFDDFFDGSVFLYSACSNRLVEGEICSEGTGFYLRYKVEAGKEYQINLHLNLARDADFNFSLFLTEGLPGEDCNVPIQALQGENSCSGKAGDIWYTYTATEDGYLEVTNCGLSDFNGYVTLYTNCSNWVTSGNSCPDGGAFFKTIVKAGTTYQIKWTLTSACTPFNFTLTESEILPGDVCTNPIIATEGENVLPSLKTSRSTYYAYTPTKDCWLDVSLCHVNWIAANGNSIEVRSDCNSIALAARQESCSNGLGVSHQVAVEKGRTYMISITNRTAFDEPVTFDLSEKDFQTGDVCRLPVTIENTDAPVEMEKTVGSVWYVFTTLEEGFYTIESHTLPAGGYGPSASSIAVKNGDCSAQTVYSSFDYTTNTYSLKIYASAGTQVYVNVTIGIQTNGVKWEVLYEEAQEGEVCSKPVFVNESFICPALGNTGVRWYAITPDKEGSLKISACGTQSFPRMELYSSCEQGIPVASSVGCSDYTGNYLEAKVFSDTTYFLKIQSIYQETPMELTLTGFSSTEPADSGYPVFSLVPNPNNGHFTVSLSQKENDEMHVLEITDLQGRPVYREFLAAGTVKHSVRVKDAVPGVYLLKITDRSKTVVRKFIIR